MIQRLAAVELLEHKLFKSQQFMGMPVPQVKRYFTPCGIVNAVASFSQLESEHPPFLTHPLMYFLSDVFPINLHAFNYVFLQLTQSQAHATMKMRDEDPDLFLHSLVACNSRAAQGLTGDPCWRQVRHIEH